MPGNLLTLIFPNGLNKKTESMTVLNWEREERREGRVGGFSMAYGYEVPSFEPDGLRIFCCDDVKEVRNCF